LRSQLTIALSPTHIAVVESRRGWRAQPHQPEIFACEPMARASDWQAPLAALRHWLEQRKRMAAQVNIIVSDHFVHYALLPWSDDVHKRAEVVALSRIHFETLFGLPASHWEIQADVGDYGQARIGCALEKDLLDALRNLLAEHGLRLASLQPYFMRAFNRWRSHFDGDALFAVVESGQCVLASCKEGAWHSIRSIRLAAHAETELQVTIEREMLLQGLGEQAKIFLHALDPVDAARLRRQPNLTLLETSASGAGQTTAVGMTLCGAI